MQSKKLHLRKMPEGCHCDGIFVDFAIGRREELKFEDDRQKGVWSFLRRLASIYPSGELPGLLTKEQLDKEVLAWTYFCSFQCNRVKITCYSIL